MRRKGEEHWFRYRRNSGGEARSSSEVVELGCERSEGLPKRRRAGRPRGVGHAAQDEAAVDAAQEQCGAEASVGDGVTVAVGDASDEAVQAEPAEVVAHAALGHRARWEPERRGEELSQVGQPEAVVQEPQGHQRLEQRLGGRGIETQGGDALAPHLHGPAHLVVGLLADHRVAAGSFHLQEAAVGRKGDLAQCGQVVQQAPDAELTGFKQLAPSWTSRWLYFLRCDKGFIA